MLFSWRISLADVETLKMTTSFDLLLVFVPLVTEHNVLHTVAVITEEVLHKLQLFFVMSVKVQITCLTLAGWLSYSYTLLKGLLLCGLLC